MDDDLKLAERLNDPGDHKRLCQGWEYVCSCRRDAEVETMLTEAATTITRLHASRTAYQDTIDGLAKERDEAIAAHEYWAAQDPEGLEQRLEAACVRLASYAKDLTAAEAQRDTALEALDTIHAIACVTTVGEPMTPNPVVDDVERIIRIATPFAASRAIEGGE